MNISNSNITIEDSLTNTDTESFSTRVEFLLQQRGTTKSWLAEKLNISRQALNQVLKHSKKPKYASEISEIFNVSPKWLRFGEGLMDLTSSAGEATLVPLYMINDSKLIKENASKNVFYDNNTNESIFAVKIDSMPSMLPLFTKGSVLIFDKHLPKSGDFTLFKFDNKIFIRKYIKEQNEIILKAYDEDFNPIKCSPDQYVHLGTLIETRIIYK